MTELESVLRLILQELTRDTSIDFHVHDTSFAPSTQNIEMRPNFSGGDKWQHAPYRSSDGAPIHEGQQLSILLFGYNSIKCYEGQIGCFNTIWKGPKNKIYLASYVR